MAVPNRLWLAPLLRSNTQGQFRLLHSTSFQPLKTAIACGDKPRQMEIVCFKTAKAQLKCTLLARWEVGYRDPWLIVTDLLPQQAQAAWYGMRGWMEAGFKDLKRGGWHWQQPAMTDPARAERLWLVLAVATLWVVSVGGQADAALSPSGSHRLPSLDLAVHPRLRSRPRLVSCLARGVAVILATFLRGDPCPTGSFYPLPWLDLPPLEAIA